MRHATVFLFLLTFATTLYAQHSAGNSSNGNSSSSSGSSSSNPSSGSSGYSGGYSGGSHSSGSSSSGSSGTSSSGGSWHSSSASSSPGAGGHSSSPSGSGNSYGNSSRGLSESHLALRARDAETKSDERRVRGLNEPTKKSSRSGLASGQISDQKKPEQKGTLRHRLFSFFRGNPPCRGKNCVTQPPCRSKNCKPTCPPGQVVSGSSCVSAFASNRDVCTSGYDPNGRCTSSQLVAPCTAPSPALLAAAEQEVERLRRQRDEACQLDPGGQNCIDLTRSYNEAILRLEELRRQAARCRTP
jgi:hypothetical protein